MAGAGLQIDVESQGKVSVLALTGPVDSATLEDFRKALHTATAGGRGCVLLDCSGLTYMNSKAFGLLSHTHRSMMSSMGQLALCNLNRKLVKTMDLLGLGQMLRQYASRDEALADFK